MLIDWSYAIIALSNRSGLSFRKIATLVHSDPRSLRRYVDGSYQPRWDTGWMILKLCEQWLTDDDWSEARIG